MGLEGPSHQRERCLFGVPLSAEAFANRVAKFHPIRRYVAQVFGAGFRVEADAPAHRPGCCDDDGPQQPGLYARIGAYLPQSPLERSLAEDQIVRNVKAADLCGARAVTGQQRFEQRRPHGNQFETI